MRLTLVAVLVQTSLLSLGTLPRPVLAQGDACAEFDSQDLAQAALDAPDADDQTRQSLDPDADGIACPDLELGRERGVPLADDLPDDLTEATVTSITDGDTLKVRIAEGDDEGKPQTIRLMGIDTPETRDPNDPVECYGAEATARLKAMLPPGRTVYLEQDISDTDRYDRALRYVWFEGKRDGRAYLVNELLVREGFAVVSTYPPDVAYVDAFTHAQDVATFRQAGLWKECGGADTPLEAVNAAPTAQAPTPVPPVVPTVAPLVTECAVFATFEEANAYYVQNPAAQPFLDPNVDGRACEVFFGLDVVAAPPPQQGPPPQEAPPPAAPPTTGGGCDPSYPTLCLPIGSPDLDCRQVGAVGFPVYQPDPHGFDRDQDGIGCEG